MNYLQDDNGPRGGRRFRMRNMLAGKNSRRIGLGSIVLSLTGYLIRDLRKPDSTIKALIQGGYSFLTQTRDNKRKAIDPEGRVDVLATRSIRPIPELEQSRES